MTRRRKLLRLARELASAATWVHPRAVVAVEVIDVLLKERPRQAPAGVIVLADRRKRR